MGNPLCRHGYMGISCKICKSQELSDAYNRGCEITKDTYEHKLAATERERDGYKHKADISDHERQYHRILRDAAAGNWWAWQGDGDDHLESLTCTVMIHPGKLQEILNAKLAAEAALAAMRERRCNDSAHGCEYVAKFQQQADAWAKTAKRQAAAEVALAQAKEHIHMAMHPELGWVWDEPAIVRLGERADRAEAELERAKEALRKYGRHEALCHALSFPGPHPRQHEPRCDCGLAVALSAPAAE